jgi:hypothetical protein
MLTITAASRSGLTAAIPVSLSAGGNPGGREYRDCAVDRVVRI